MQPESLEHFAPLARETVLNGEPVTIRYGYGLTDMGAQSMPAPLGSDFNAEQVIIHYGDGSERGAELPRVWRDWTDAELIEKLPMCRLLPRRR